MADEIKTKKKGLNQNDRVILASSLKSKLDAWLSQANQALNGVSKVSKSDLVNLILNSHPEELNCEELDQLKAAHLDQVKLAYWVAHRLKEARDSGESLSLQEILAANPTIFVAAPKPRKARKKRSSVAETKPGRPETYSSPVLKDDFATSE